MASKKYRKKLKEKHNNIHFHFLDYDHYAQEDREAILNFLKENPNEYFTSTEIILSVPLNYQTSSSISMNIKFIRENIDGNIVAKRRMGYMYVR